MYTGTLGMEEPPKYSEIEYWNARYLENHEPFDWLVSYADGKEVINNLIPIKSSKVLIAGCGDAPFSIDMCSDGYTGLVNVDLSVVIIERQRLRFPEMDWRIMDMLDLSSIEPCSLDAVVDKSTLDALVDGAGGNKVVRVMADEVKKASDRIVTLYNKALHQVARVLRPGGIYLGWSLHTEAEVFACIGDLDWIITMCKVSFFFCANAYVFDSQIIRIPGIIMKGGESGVCARGAQR
jgi:SAM-dependent methyltransferase